MARAGFQGGAVRADTICVDTGAGDAVVACVGASRYAVPMADVAEVGRTPALTRVPGTPPWVAGAANWRGRVLAVIDPHPLLSGGAAPADVAAAGRLVVLQRAGLVVGLLVDRIDGTLALPAAVEPPPSTLTGTPADLVAGTLTDGQGPLGLLDVGAVLALRERLAPAG